MSRTAVKLLQAAAETAGGPKALADRLGIGEGVLALLMSGCRELPDALLLRAVDVILAERQSRLLSSTEASPRSECARD